MFNPKTNNSLIHLEQNKYLENIINKKSFANGYIFYGPDGIGKKQTALHFIQKIFKEYSSSINIENKIFNNNHPDFLVVEPTALIKNKLKKGLIPETPKKNYNEIIKIEQIRNIRTFLSKKSINSEKKVVLILETHLLNEGASNCLLKIL